MKRNTRRITIFSGLLLLPAVIVLLLLLLAELTAYRPALRETLSSGGMTLPVQVPQRPISLLTWNIGYGGLGKEMDFFYENGKRVRPSADEFSYYLTGIKSLLAGFDSIDLILIQEADVHSKRSYNTDENEAISQILPRHSSIFAKNYDCRFIPFPPDEPVGKVVSGISCFTGLRPESAERISFGTAFSWPKRLFFPNRCFLVLRYNVGEKKQLVLLNTHNSTFDEGGEMRKKEVLILKTFMTKEFERGNYVIAGGDWNNNPPDFRPERIRSGDVVKKVKPAIDPAAFPDWQVAYDPAAPTNRDVDMPYRQGITKATIIDFFIVSPNVEVESVRTIPTGFRCSDHQPVYMRVRLK